jgi:hypothetical protein
VRSSPAHLFISLLQSIKVPYSSNHEGRRDIQTFFQEAVVSIHDGPTWVGDVDILKVLEQRPQPILRLRSLCPHDPLYEFESPWLPDKPIIPKRISSIVKWHELLDSPNNPAVVKANGNWVGRLAAMALCAQKGHGVIILPPDYCSNCFGEPDFGRDWAICMQNLPQSRSLLCTE